MSDGDQHISISSGRRRSPDDFSEPDRFSEPGSAHLVGIAGAGMRSLGQVLLDRGWQVTGSDRDAESVGHLVARGAQVGSGHSAAYLPDDADVVIHSDAVGENNPELRRAVGLGIPTISYFQALGRLMSGKRGLAVAGTHGKSTTTAMAAELLTAGGVDPTFVYGAAPLGQAGGGRSGTGDVVLVEACEYRANFLHLRPEQAVITGIEPDHFDYYRSTRELEHAFARFVGNVPENGLILAEHSCPRALRVAAESTARVETFGFASTADWTAGDPQCERGRYSFTIIRHGRWLGRVRLRVPGRHNVQNALAAAALAWENGVHAETIVGTLERFAGLKRRLELLGRWRGVTLLDDYAHHPTEVTAALGTVRRIYPKRRLWCVFQPHQVSRTEHLLDELAASLQNADKVLVADIFRAREPLPRTGDVTSSDLVERIRAGGTFAAHLGKIGAIRRLLETELRPGDVLITIGAGDIGKIWNEFLDGIREDRAAS